MKRNIKAFLYFLLMLISMKEQLISYEESIELSMFFIQSKRPTGFCSPIKISISVRNMLKKSASLVPTIVHNPELNQHISRQTLGFFKLILNEEVVNSLVKDNDPKPFIKHTLNYILNDEGNVVLKTNFLTGAVRYPLQLDSISPVYKLLHEKSHMTFSNSNQVVYPRIFAEIGINHGWVTEHKAYIQNSMITGDTIKTTSKTQPYPDKIDTYRNGKVISGDIKSGTEMVKAPLKGTLGEITYLNGKQLAFPNNEVNLDKFNAARNQSILGHRNQFVLTNEEQIEFVFCTEKISVLNNNLNLDNVKKYLEVEQLLVQLNMLPGVTKRMSFIHIRNCVEEKLTTNEKSFITLLGSRIENRAIFDNQYSYNKFIIEALVLYHNTVDKTTKEKLFLLKYSTWKPTFIDEIDFTLFK